MQVERRASDRVGVTRLLNNVDCVFVNLPVQAENPADMAERRVIRHIREKLPLLAAPRVLADGPGAQAEI
jgi:hypothetical protein